MCLSSPSFDDVGSHFYVFRSNFYRLSPCCRDTFFTWIFDKYRKLEIMLSLAEICSNRNEFTVKEMYLQDFIVIIISTISIFNLFHTFCLSFDLNNSAAVLVSIPRQLLNATVSSGYTTYGRNISPFWLPSAKIIGGRLGIFAPWCKLLSSKLLLYSVRFELKLTICRCESNAVIVFCPLKPFECAVNSRLASSNLSPAFGILFDAWWSLVLPFDECVVAAAGLFELWEIAAATPCPVLDEDDDADDDADADFFSLASCWAFFERFHFIRRFWNHILTYLWGITEN